MSVITQCPACKTLFRVTPELLLASEGWGRCGQCREVFEAKPYSPPPQMPALDFSASPMLDAYSFPAADESDNDSSLDEGSSTQGARGWLRLLGWVLLVLVLVGAGGLQYVLHERDGLAAQKSKWTSPIQKVCAWVGCEIRPYRDADAVVIEGSSFSRTAAGDFRLSLTLKNTSAYELAAPALELTLTDALDQVVLRKVMAPADLGWPSGRFMPEHTVQLDVAVQLQPAADAPGPVVATSSVAGYRVLAFYP
jgi:predicted Zn finger-like uncharacterized protein